MDQTRRDQIGSLYLQQRHRATTYKPKTPEVPTKHNCAGECTHPIPPPPVSNETFESGPAGLPREWWMMMGGVSVVLVLLCLPVRLR